MGVLDDFAELADTFVEEFDNGVDGGTGGLALYFRSRTIGAYSATVQARSKGVTTTNAISMWSRTRGSVFTSQGASGAQRKFEEFFVVVVIADAVAAGWPSATQQPDETTELLVGADGASGIFPVVICERVMKEKAWRIKVRRDLGPAT